MRTLSIPINCGEKTCASAPGVFCKQIRTLKYGQIWICNIFEKELEIKNGWTQRCDQCLQHEEDINQ